MACFLRDDGPMTAAQLFNYIRLRFDGLPASFLSDRNAVIVPLLPGTEAAAEEIRELAVRKGLSCSQVSAIWPEGLGAEVVSREEATDFLVISEIRGKFLQSG